MPAQWTPQVVPPQRVAMGQALTPVHVTVLFWPTAVTPPGQADAPVQLTLHVSALQVTPDVHELEPHVTWQLEPPHDTALQLDAAAQSTVHALADAQSTATAPPTVTFTEQARPAGQTHGFVEHVRLHTPPSHEPPAHAATQAEASRVGRASARASSAAPSPAASTPAPPSDPGAAPSVDRPSSDASREPPLSAPCSASEPVTAP